MLSVLPPETTGAPQSPGEGFGPPSPRQSPPASPTRGTDLLLVLVVVSPDLVEAAGVERAAALIALEALFGDQLEFNEAGGAVIGAAVQLLALHEVVSCLWSGMSPRHVRRGRARWGGALVREEGEARMAVVCELIDVPSSVRIDDAAGKVLAHQPQQRHRAGGVGDAQRVGHLEGVSLACVADAGEQGILRHA